MLLYVILGIIGSIFLVTMLFAGDEGDIASLADIRGSEGASGAPAFLNTRVLGAFLAAFGISGAVARHTGFTHLATAGIAIGAGVVLGAIVHQLTKSRRSP